eukprot:TRINITY_DN139_c0_g1_i2.p1 TRINITY_DN139_c0_g1~~TRINITY_DN139_c0_g1_i2.p1  ORF type:complete len:126 (+),score=35.50 TRINITY_DN139_c0_g1_i2:110-487(+)
MSEKKSKKKSKKKKNNNKIVIETEEEINRKKEKRKRVAQELLETERIYVNDLNVLLTYFHSPMIKNATGTEPVLTMEDVKSVFGSLKVMSGYNTMLLSELEEAIENPTDDMICVGGVFNKMVSNI